MPWKIIKFSREGLIINFTYKLLFNQSQVVDTYLPAPALFDYHNKGRYFVLESEARAHTAAVEAARQAEASAPRASVSYHADYYPPGYWFTTKLCQKPKLGGVRISTDIIFMFTHFIPVFGVHTFSLYYPCYIFPSFLLVCLKNFRKTKKLVVVIYFPCMLSSSIKKKTQKDFLVLLLLVGSFPV